MGRFSRFWLPVVLYVGLIFLGSSLGSLQAPPMFGGLSDKIPHAVEYGILGFLLVRAIRGTDLLPTSVTAGLVAILIGLVVGLADELYQAHVPGRQSDPLDYAADGAGLVISVVLFLLLRAWTRNRRAAR